MLRKAMSSAGVLEMDHSCCCESAAFFNESIIRETITGRYLEPSVSQSDERRLPDGGAHTTTPLVQTTKRVMSIVVQGADSVTTHFAGRSWIVS